jgi:hypothetical protein
MGVTCGSKAGVADGGVSEDNGKNEFRLQRGTGDQGGVKPNIDIPSQ